MKQLLPAIIAGCALFNSSFAQESADLVTEEVVVTATRFEEKAGSQAIGVSVISAEEIQASGVQNLPQLLERQSGIGFRDSTGGPDPQIDMRGFGINGDQNTLVLVDGVRLNDNELSSVRWSSIPLASIERIEILRGSGAVLYGGGATGGVINIITRKAAKNEKSADLMLRGGSYDANGVAVNGAVAGDSVGLRINSQYDETNNYRDHNSLRQRNVDMAVRTLGTGPGIGLAVGAEAQDLELPGPRNKALLESDRRGTASPDDFSDRDSNYVRLTGTIPLGMGEAAADIGYRTKSIEAFITGTDFSSDATVWNFTPRLRVPYEALGLRNQLVAGFDLEKWDYDSTRTGPAQVSAKQDNSAFYLLHSTDFPTQTRLTLGGRIQRVDYEAADATSAASYAAGTQERKPRAYEAALRQPFGERISVYGKVGRSFRIATVDEIYSQFGGPFFDPRVAFLEPQTSNDRELGVELAAGGLRGRLAVYQMDLENEIHLNPVTFANVNLPPTERHGLELNLAKTFMELIELSGSYTFTVSKYREGSLNGVDVTGNSVSLVPRHRASMTAAIALAERTRLYATATYTGEQFYDGDETNDFGSKMPDYTVVDLRLAHDIANWRFVASVNNLLDEKYYSYAVRSQFTPGAFNAYPQPERNFFLSAQYRFGP